MRLTPPRPRLSMRLMLALVAASALPAWTYRDSMSPYHRWRRALRDDQGSGIRWELAGDALRGRIAGLSAEQAVSDLIAALSDRSPRVRESAAAILGRAGARADRAVPALANALKDRRLGARIRAARSLGSILAAGGPSREAAGAALAAALGDESPSVRRAAAQSLGEIAGLGAGPGPGSIAADLRGRLADRDAGVRVTAAYYLARLGHADRAFPALVGALGEREPAVRALALQALIGLGRPAKAAVPAVRPLAEDDHPIIRKMALDALKAIDPPPAADDGG